MIHLIRSGLGFVLRVVPTLLALAVLAGVAWWGHRTGWKFPSWSEIRGTAEVREKEDWCTAHNVPDSRCIACHPELGGEDPADWCAEHGVAESKCTVCHPEILTSGKAADWCVEHGVPESQCTLCHPDVAVKGTPPEDRSGRVVVVDPAAPPPKDPSTCQTHALRVQFASPAAVEKAGIGLAAVEMRPMPAFVAAPGEVRYDATRMARCSSRLPGSLARVEKDIGQAVRKGDVLALVDAAEAGRAKAEFLQALALAEVRDAAFKRFQSSAAEGFRTQAELLVAEGELREARLRLEAAHQALLNLGLGFERKAIEGIPPEERTARLRLLGLPDAAVEAVGAGTATANLLAVTSPLDGTVIDRDAVQGEVIEPARSLFVVADMSRMWVKLNLRLDDASRVALGQPVTFIPDGAIDEPALGQITWISTEVDEKTRTLEVRAEMPNPEGRLRAGTFGRGRITIRPAAEAVAVPEAAVNWEGCCHVVFVRLTDEIFQTRKVRLGVAANGFREVAIGLEAGEVVAAAGSQVLKADILRSRLGAG